MTLRGKAVAVCGSTEDRHGIVLAKSDLAKKAGVKTGMVIWEARQPCPDLVVVPPQYEQYLKYSKLAHEIYYRYTDLVEPFGMDECWLDDRGADLALALAVAGSVLGKMLPDGCIAIGEISLTGEIRPADRDVIL